MKLHDARFALGVGALLATLGLASCNAEQPASGESVATDAEEASLVVDYGELAVATYELPGGDLRSDVLDAAGEVVFVLYYWADKKTVSYWAPEGTPVDFEEGMVPEANARSINEAAHHVYERVLRAASGVEPFDAPGCDGVPDDAETPCLSRCCAEHDRCFAANGCTALSWCHLWGACRNCNVNVVACFIVCDDFDHNQPDCSTWPCGCNQWECYDAATNQTYCANTNCAAAPVPPVTPPGGPVPPGVVPGGSVGLGNGHGDAEAAQSKAAPSQAAQSNAAGALEEEEICSILASDASASK